MFASFLSFCTSCYKIYLPHYLISFLIVPIFERSDNMIHKQMEYLNMSDGDQHSPEEELPDERETEDQLVAGDTQVTTKKVRFAENLETEHDIDHSDDNDELWLSVSGVLI